MRKMHISVLFCVQNICYVKVDVSILALLKTYLFHKANEEAFWRSNSNLCTNMSLQDVCVINSWQMCFMAFWFFGKNLFIFSYHIKAIRLIVQDRFSDQRNIKMPRFLSFILYDTYSKFGAFKNKIQQKILLPSPFSPKNSK